MKLTDEQIQQIVTGASERFRCFGGGKGDINNPLSMALINRPPSFAAGVNVEDVVRFVLDQAREHQLATIRALLQEQSS